MAEEKTINIDFKPPITDGEVAPTDVNTGTNQDFINSKFLETYQIKKHLTTVPTYNPKNYYEQISLVDNGTKSLYANINGVWTLIGIGNMSQTIGTSLPTASTNSGNYYYLTTTDTLYRSNGTAWIALN